VMDGGGGFMKFSSVLEHGKIPFSQLMSTMPDLYLLA